MTNPDADIPRRAHERVSELVQAEHSRRERAKGHAIIGTSIGYAFARYIAEKEGLS